MSPRLYFFWGAVVFCAAIALIFVRASAQNSSACFTFQAYGGESRNVAIRNTCSECRKAVVEWCDGSTLSLDFPASRGWLVQGFPGCVIRIASGQQCAKQLFHTPWRQLAKTQGEAKKSHALKPRDEKQAMAGPAAGDQVANSTNDAGVSATNSMEAAKEPSSIRCSAVPSQKDTTIVQPKIQKRTATQMAVLPDASEEDWGTLLCSESGQSLVRQTEALLNRRAVLQVMLGEMWFSPDAADRQEAWIAADKELQAINKELSQFQEKAKAIIHRTVKN